MVVTVNYLEVRGMLKSIFKLYRLLFVGVLSYKFYDFVYRLSSRGIGILNYESDGLSGEENFIKTQTSNIKNGIIFDVGANVGNYAKKLRESNPSVRIFCFEPHPINFQKLCDNTSQLDIELLNVGVGSAEGKLKLYDYVDEDGSSHASLYKDVIETIHKKKSIEYEVDVITLDDFVNLHSIEKISLLKIDTEGHELAVLKGFECFIRMGKVELIQFEFNEMNIVSRTFFKDFWDFLPNYDFYRMLPNGFVPIKNYSPFLCEIFAYQNIVAKLKGQS